MELNQENGWVRWLIAIENAGKNYSAYAPEIPGCISTGPTVEDTKRRMVEALEAHIETMIEDGVDPDLPDDDTAYCLVSVRVPTRGKDATGETLRDYRRRNGLTQEALASKLEVTKATISEWENGKRPLPGTMKFVLETVG